MISACFFGFAPTMSISVNTCLLSARGGGTSSGRRVGDREVVYGTFTKEGRYLA